MKKYNISKLANMKINIIEAGIEAVWNSIELEKDALKRCELRKLFARATKI